MGGPDPAGGPGSGEPAIGRPGTAACGPTTVAATGVRGSSATGSSAPHHEPATEAHDSHADVLEACLRHGESEADNSIVIEEIRRRVL